jgi:hypothetical protein
MDVMAVPHAYAGHFLTTLWSIGSILTKFKNQNNTDKFTFTNNCNQYFCSHIVPSFDPIFHFIILFNYMFLMHSNVLPRQLTSVWGRVEMHARMISPSHLQVFLLCFCTNRVWYDGSRTLSNHHLCPLSTGSQTDGRLVPHFNLFQCLGEFTTTAWIVAFRYITRIRSHLWPSNSSKPFITYFELSDDHCTTKRKSFSPIQTTNVHIQKGKKKKKRWSLKSQTLSPGLTPKKKNIHADAHTHTFCLLSRINRRH